MEVASSGVARRVLETWEKGMDDPASVQIFYRRKICTIVERFNLPAPRNLDLRPSGE